MNKFYEQNILIQWTVAILFLIMAIAIVIFWSFKSSGHPLSSFTILPLIPFFQFLITPFSKLTGMYTYLSPMLLVFGASDKKYDLHNGTSFDYLFVMRKTKPGLQAQKKILNYFIEGLLNIIKEIEGKELPETITISGSSYFFSEQTASRLGFEITPASLPEKLNIYLNIIDLIWMYSYAQGKFSFPKISKVKKVKTTGKELVKNKEALLKLHQYLSRNESN